MFFQCLLELKRSYKRKGKKEKNTVKSRLNSLKELGRNIGKTWNRISPSRKYIVYTVLFYLSVILGK